MDESEFYHHSFLYYYFRIAPTSTPTDFLSSWKFECSSEIPGYVTTVVQIDCHWEKEHRTLV